MVALDPRINPFRPEIAAKHLQGQVEAKRFVEGKRHQVIEPNTALRRAPSHDAGLDTEALLGERVMIYETTDEGWAWGQLETDGYVGWLSANALGPSGPAATHKVTALRALAFPGPDIRMPPLAALPMGAQVTIARQDEQFAVTVSGWHIPEAFLVPIKARRSDFVSVAEQFLGSPYLWGGKTSLGVDCSGLVQVSLQAAGVPCPRDSDMQELVTRKTVVARKSPPRRSRLLEGPRGDRARPREPHPCERTSHGGGHRAGCGRDRAHQGRGQRGYRR